MNTRLSFLAAAALAAALTAGPAAADSLQNASDATGDSLEASARIVASGGQIVLGAVAIPLTAGGGLSEATGEAAADSGEALWQTANAPLVVDDAVMVAAPPPDVPRLPRDVQAKREGAQ